MTMRPDTRSLARRARLTLAAFGLSFGLGAHAQELPGEAAETPGRTYASLEDLPDLGGWWTLSAGFPGQSMRPLKPELLALMEEIRARELDTTTADRPEEADLGLDPVALFCAPPSFKGLNQGPFEILLTPGRITIANEFGLVRRIRMDQEQPVDVLESNAGTSTGRWEGRTLVVETTGLNSKQAYDPYTAPSFKLGKGVRVFERFSLREPDVLVIELRMIAPDVFTAPFEHTITYRRERDHVFYEQTYCVENDRSFDRATGRQRFDLTPPEDLPPPPSE
jgi:hypothetical protein